MENWLRGEYLYAVARAVTVFTVGLVAAHLVRSAVGSVVTSRWSAQHALLARRISYYLVLGLAAVSALREVGFDFTVLLGAAGIVTVALGFAAQTSASNLISGLFLVSEQPFVLGEVIRIGDTTGEVISIDLLSVKLRTFDNLFVRVPNETVIKAQITNFTRLPIRRYDLQVSVAYKENLADVQELLMEVAERNPLCLREPAPLIIFQGFGDSGVTLQLSVWAARENYLALRNAVAEEVKGRLDAAGIEIPFPHRTLYAGAETPPLPVQLVTTS